MDDEEEQEVIDWALVDEELAGINDVWKEPRFDTLPHVVEVLTCSDPQDAIDALTKQRDAIEVLVDDVVHIYYVGFNKAIRNYSQILKVFGESADAMGKLKESLATARKLLGNRHKQLQQLWSRSITLRHIIELIDQIESISKVPQRVETLVKGGQLYAAVQAHLQAASMLEREGILSIGALKDIRNDMSTIKAQLFNKVLDELQLHLYNKGKYSPKAEVTEDDDDDDISKLVPVPVPAVAPLHPALVAQGYTSPQPSTLPSAALRARKGGSVRGGPEAGGDEGADGSMAVETAARKAKVLPPVWVTEASANEFVERIARSSEPQHVKYLQTMVECLAMLGKISGAGTALSQRVRATVREIIVEEVKEVAATASSARPRVDSATSKHPPPSSSTSSTGPTAALVMPGQRSPADLSSSSAGTVGSVVNPTGAGVHLPNGPSQVLAQELLEAAVKRLTGILENHIMVGNMMEEKASKDMLHYEGSHSHSYTSSSPHQGQRRDSFEGQGGAGVGSGSSRFSPSTGGYNVAFVWSCVQSECQQLLCDILRATPGSQPADLSDTMGGLQLNDASDSITGFSFRFSNSLSLTGEPSTSSSSLLSSSGGGRRKGPTAMGAITPAEGFGTAQLLPDRGIYLTCACYRPILQFTEKVCQLLPPQYAELGRSGLRPFMDNFVKDQFLPTIRSGYRTRVADALINPSAFRPKAKTVGVYESSLSAGRPVLSGPLSVEAVAHEVLAWAVALPVYAGELVGLVHTLLERALERCKTVLTETVLGSLSSTLVSRADMESLMSQQAAAQLLVLEEGEATVAQLQEAREDPLLESDAYELEMELYSKLFALQPVKEEQLITDPSRLILLAALSDTLEYFSDAILRLGRPQSSSKSVRSAKPSSSSASSSSTPQFQSQQSSLSSSSFARKKPVALTPALQRLSDKYRALAKEALRTLRLEMQLQTIFELQYMANRSYISDVDAEEPEDFVVALTSQLTRLDEEMTVYIAAPRRYYVFGGVCSLAATSLIRTLSDLKGINAMGVRQVQRNCIALQQTLATLGASSSESVQLSLDRVGEYFELLNRPYEALLAYVKDHRTYFSLEEYTALLQVYVPGRQVPLDGALRIARILHS